MAVNVLQLIKALLDQRSNKYLGNNFIQQNAMAMLCICIFQPISTKRLIYTGRKLICATPLATEGLDAASLSE
jgi:hypothetical protein